MVLANFVNMTSTYHTGSSNDEGILSNRNLASLLGLLRDAAPCWKDLGLYLGFRNIELEIIERKPMLIHDGCPGYLREMLSQWLKWAPPNHPLPTVLTLALALRKAGEDSVALHLETVFRGEGLFICTHMIVLVLYMLPPSFSASFFRYSSTIAHV